MKRLRTALLTALVLAGLVGTAVPASALPPDFRSGHGIEVRNVMKTTARTYVVNIHTNSVDTRALAWKFHDVVITLPSNYNPNLAYPVLYLYHGRAQGPGSWHNEADIEAVTHGYPIITVAADAGWAGWGTNWVNQSAGVQQWDRFHLDELIPWVDANLNTVRAREGRAVAGFSMGGFVAIRHAAHRPGLFRMAIGMSGGYDLEDQRMRVAVTAPLVEKGLPLDGPFGAPWDGSWGFNNPWHRVGALRGVHTVLYGGTRHDDLLEQQAHRLTYEFHQHLLANGVTNSWMVQYDCGHWIECAARNGIGRELPVMMTVLRHP
ncbi:alpha/beta hydrolase [Saccharothrix longispora]|uniref:alpha/beta hydrolase n=1 Tax=Saccharothrix longispora TaxID=33920 RepID=UPI0028FD2F1D|nr:alpha/beta hydrolase-fold protein [Saccharothrix longispora]MDU0294487.1 alpha/beta hydrolase-fold protein [Saccharothrix longispora]